MVLEVACGTRACRVLEEARGDVRRQPARSIGPVMLMRKLPATSAAVNTAAANVIRLVTRSSCARGLARLRRAAVVRPAHGSVQGQLLSQLGVCHLGCAR